MLAGPPLPILASSPSWIYCSVTLACLPGFRTAKLNTKSKLPPPGLLPLNWQCPPPPPLNPTVSAQCLWVVFFLFSWNEMSDMESNFAEVEWKMKHTEQEQLNCFWVFFCAPTPACRLQVGWFRQHAHCSSSPLFLHRKRADSKIDPVWGERKSISCKSWSLCLFRNLSGRKYPGYLQLQASLPPPLSIFPRSSSFFRYFSSLAIAHWLPCLCLCDRLNAIDSCK